MAIPVRFDRGYHYKRCPTCRSLFIADPPSLDQLRERYSESYFEAAATDLRDRQGYPAYPAVRDSARSSFARKLALVGSKQSSGTLLDAGAAYGTFLQLASSKFTGMGLELSVYAAARARHQFHTNVQVGALEQAPFRSAAFDIIVMWDVIEHLRSPVTALQEVHRMLKVGGFCFISTDDVDHWLVRLLGKRWWGIAPPFHLCHLSKPGLESALVRAGSFGPVEFGRDTRSYGLAELVQHLAVAYQNAYLMRLGALLDHSRLGRLVIDVTRPEQFIAIAQRIA